MADNNRSTDGMGAGLLVSELAEVYLLLDNVSAVASKPVPDLDTDPLFQNVAGTSWIEQICEIRWPPDPAKPQNEALNAAKLIRAKDKLNRAAFPASGASIAFTKMMSGDSVDTWVRRRRWWQVWLTEPDTMDERLSADAAAMPRLDRLVVNDAPRKCLASFAFPELYRRAARYRMIYNLLHVCLVAALLATCLMSWRLAIGSSLLNDVTRSTVVENAPPQLTGSATDSAVSNSTAATTPPPANTGPVSKASDQNREIATQNLMRWVAENQWMEFMVGGSGQRLSYDAAGSTPKAPHQVPNVAWAAVLIGVLTGTVLPILYGMLGASAAVVRSLASKMSASTLMPRDLVLGLVQFGLGAVIGACVSLFISGDGNGATSAGGLIGPVKLSTSALCFLAGFGVEGVFRALETLVGRVFPVAPAIAPAPPPQPINVTVQAPPPSGGAAGGGSDGGAGSGAGGGTGSGAGSGADSGAG